MLNWIPPELAPKDGTQILAVFTSYPFPVMAVWCGASSTWCAAVPQVDMYAGEMNDWYFENEHFPAEHLKVWEDVTHNTDFEPLTDGVEVADDIELVALETNAAELAATGTKCCIRWSRDSDGQEVACWGPTGAALKPHWYTKPGRPKEMQGGKRRNVYLDDASWAEAVKRGNGNASEGIRKALDCGV